MASKRARMAVKWFSEWFYGPDGRINLAERIDAHFPGYDDLLAACRAMLEVHDTLGGCRDDGLYRIGQPVIDAARSALAKAGVTP